MQGNYLEKIFINPAIEYGIRGYLLSEMGENYERIHTFEVYVIKALTIIYGEKSILLPYKIDNENAFKCNLLIYDLKEKDMENFLKYLNEYYNFMKNYKSEKKATGLIDEVEKILMEMILKRSKRKPFTKEELNTFDTIFNPSNGDLKQLKQLVTSNDGLIQRKWQSNKDIITNTQYKLMAINPNLYDPKLYYKYGYDIRTIASLTDEEIEEVNKSIYDEENKVIEHKTKKKEKLVLSSGIILVDTILLCSIVATEIMIGLIIISRLWG